VQGEPEGADKGTSLGFTVDEGYAIFVALTPSPSPTEWERDVGAHTGSCR